MRNITNVFITIIVVIVGNHLYIVIVYHLSSSITKRLKNFLFFFIEVKEPTEEDSQSQKPMAEIPFQNPIFICAIIIYAIIIYYWFDIKL